MFLVIFFLSMIFFTINIFYFSISNFFFSLVFFFYFTTVIIWNICPLENKEWSIFLIRLQCFRIACRNKNLSTSGYPSRQTLTIQWVETSKIFILQQEEGSSTERNLCLFFLLFSFLTLLTLTKNCHHYLCWNFWAKC